MPTQPKFATRLSIAIVAAFIAALGIALSVATQTVSATPGNGNGNPNPHKYTATPTIDRTGTFAAGATQTEIYRLTNQPAWTETGLAQLTAILGTMTAGAATREAERTATAAAQTPTP